MSDSMENYRDEWDVERKINVRIIYDYDNEGKVTGAHGGHCVTGLSAELWWYVLASFDGKAWTVEIQEQTTLHAEIGCVTTTRLEWLWVRPVMQPFHTPTVRLGHFIQTRLDESC